MNNRMHAVYLVAWIAGGLLLNLLLMLLLEAG